VPIQDTFDILGMKRNVPHPVAESPMFVNGPNPLGQELPFGTILGGILAFHFQHEHGAVSQPDQEVGTVFPDDSP